MERFPTKITHEQFCDIIDNNKLTKENRFLIDSYTPHTLVETCFDLKNNELQEVYLLETKNIFRIFSTQTALLKVYGEEVFQIATKNIPYKYVQECIKTSHEIYSKERERAGIIYYMMCTYLLSPSEQKLGKYEFQGKMPSKLFSFRQTTADKWYADFIQHRLLVTRKIYEQLGIDDAIAYILMNTAYYLNKSQTFKYYARSTDKDFWNTITNVLADFFEEVGGEKPDFSRFEKNILYKDL